jgi:hypothetical protein
VPVQEPAMSWWLRSRKTVDKAFRRRFDSLFFMLAWMLWKERNARTFNGVSKTAIELAHVIHDEATSSCLAGNRHLSRLLARL